MIVVFTQVVIEQTSRTSVCLMFCVKTSVSADLKLVCVWCFLFLEAVILKHYPHNNPQLSRQTNRDGILIRLSTAQIDTIRLFTMKYIMHG